VVKHESFSHFRQMNPENEMFEIRWDFFTIRT